MNLPLVILKSVNKSIDIIVSYTMIVIFKQVTLILMFPYSRTKTIRRQPIINGGINVEIGNPSYNMYEVDHDHNDGGLLDPGFMIDPAKVICFKMMDS